MSKAANSRQALCGSSCGSLQDFLKLFLMFYRSIFPLDLKYVFRCLRKTIARPVHSMLSNCCKTRDPHSGGFFLLLAAVVQDGHRGDVLAGTWTSGCDTCQENDVRTAVEALTESLCQDWCSSSNQGCELPLPVRSVWTAWVWVF